MIAGYQGQTAIKTSEVIDEAYSLVQDDNDTYGKESIATILKEMEDNCDDLIVIVAVENLLTLTEEDVETVLDVDKVESNE